MSDRRWVNRVNTLDMLGPSIHLKRIGQCRLRPDLVADYSLLQLKESNIEDLHVVGKSECTLRQ